jgi:hypothetical protein
LSRHHVSRDVITTITDDKVFSITAVADATAVTEVNDMSSSAVGIAVGVAVALVVLLILIAAVITFLIRRRGVRRSNKSIVKIENPQYKLADSEDRDATLSTAPTVKFTANSNTASVGVSSSSSRKRKEAPAPPAPIYRPPADTARTWDSLTKRKAPPPPLNIKDVYAKDSPTASVENISSAVNTNAVSPVDDSHDLQTDLSHMQPLIDSGNVDKKLSSKRDSKLTSPQKQSPSVLETKRKEEEDDNGAATDAKVSLIGKKAASNLSLDSYDRTKNPFFTD